MSTERKIPCDVHLDESSQNGLRFTVIGGVIAPSDDAKEITEQIQSEKPHSSCELKWNRLDKQNLSLYKRVLDIFLARRAAEQLYFHCIVLDNEKIDYAPHSYGDVDLGFNKFTYQIVMKFTRLHADHVFYVYLDERKTYQTGEEFRAVLNNGADRKFNRRPFKLVEFRKSHLTPLIQLADVLSGAVAYEANGHAARPDASKAKLDFLKTLKTALGVTSFRSSTPF